MECINLIEELYQSRKSYVFVKDSNMETFQTSSGVKGKNEGLNQFNLFPDHKCEEMGTDHLNILYYILN